MTTITLDVPDELVPQLQKLQTELPQLLSMAVSLYQETAEHPRNLTESAALNEMLDFLVGSPSAEEIAAYKVSPAIQDRLEELLDKNREDVLSASEQAELTSYQQLNHLFILLKARSRNQLSH